MPGAPIGAKTGKPAAPMLRYNTKLAAPSRGPSRPPTNNTAGTCNVIGIGVAGNGIATCAPSATTNAPMTSAIIRGMGNAYMPVVVDTSTVAIFTFAPR